MSTLREKTERGLLWGALNNGTMQALNALVGICLARLLTTGDYGLVGMLAIFTAIASTLQESGFTSALTNTERPTDNDYNAVFWFSTLMSLVLYAILFCCAPLIAGFFRHPELIDLSRLLFLSLLFSALGTAPAAYLFKNLMVRETTVLRISSLIVSSLVAITMAYNGMGYWALAWMNLLYVALTSIGRFFLIDWRPSLRIDFGPIRRMFSFSYKVLITSIANAFSQNLLTFIFGKLFPVGTVGNYSQAFKWDNQASSFVSGTIAQVAQPILVEINEDTDRQLHVFRKMLRFTSFLTFPAMFGLSMVAHEFILLAIKARWIDSIPLLRILCISGAFLPFYTMYQNLVISKGRSDLYMWATLSLLATQLGLVLLFHHHGIVFIVGLYTLTVILWLGLWQCFAHRLIGLRLRDALKDTVPFAAVAAAVMAFTYLITQPIHSLWVLLPVRIAIAAALYTGIMKLLRVKMFEECIAYFRKKHRR